MSDAESDQDLGSREVERAEEWFQERYEFTIYRVPPEIRECDRKAYEPKAVCIGPFFYDWRNRSGFVTMQFYKKFCKKQLISDYGLHEEEAWKKMMDLLDEVRKKYSVRFKHFDDPETFSNMLMLDGCFLLYLLLRYADPDNVKFGPADVGIVHDRLWIWNLVRNDLLLLQNQIPFSVILTLYDLLSDDKKNTNLVDAAINFFSPLEPCRDPKKSCFYIPVGKVHHLLHLIYSSLLPCPQRGKSFPEEKSSQVWIPSATELRLAGIKFKERKKAQGFQSFLDVQFSHGVMEIPKLQASDHSISLFRNLIAFEQCFLHTECHVTAYAFFMNFLTNTMEDMRLLHRKKILINIMTVKDEIKDPTHFFSRLCNEVPNRKNYLGNLFIEVTNHHDSKFYTWRAEIYGKFFKSPLTVLSLIGGFLVLMFQGTQFIRNIDR